MMTQMHGTCEVTLNKQDINYHYALADGRRPTARSALLLRTKHTTTTRKENIGSDA